VSGALDSRVAGRIPAGQLPVNPRRLPRHLVNSVVPVASRGRPGVWPVRSPPGLAAWRGWRHGRGLPQRGTLSYMTAGSAARRAQNGYPAAA